MSIEKILIARHTENAHNFTSSRITDSRLHEHIELSLVDLRNFDRKYIREFEKERSREC